MSVEQEDWAEAHEQARESPIVDPRKIVFAYLSCPSHSANSFVGALLLTDGRTRPLHFAFTDPVTPNTLQKILHGSTLEVQIKIDVIAAKLFESLPREPDYVFVNGKDLLGIRELVNKPTAFLSKLSQDGDNRNLTVTYDTGDNIGDQDLVGRVVCQLDDRVDLIEPFARLMEALKEAQRQSPTKPRQ